ncbi:MAG: hypothetical protein QMD80_09565 [archaeon]|nr:hypothetical protein [archaeon]
MWIRVSKSMSSRCIGNGGNAFFQHRFVITITYLILVACAELLTVYDAKYGIAFHALVLFALLIHSSLISPYRACGVVGQSPTADSELSRLLMVLFLAPIIRILSLSMPLGHFSYINWFAIISIPVFIAIFTCMHLQHIKPADVGLTLPKLKHLPIEVATLILAIPLVVHHTGYDG